MQTKQNGELATLRAMANGFLHELCAEPRGWQWDIVKVHVEPWSEGVLSGQIEILGIRNDIHMLLSSYWQWGHPDPQWELSSWDPYIAGSGHYLTEGCETPGEAMNAIMAHLSSCGRIWNALDIATEEDE